MEGILFMGYLEIEGQVSKGMRQYWMGNWIGIEDCCQCLWRYRLFEKISEYPRFIRVKIW